MPDNVLRPCTTRPVIESQIEEYAKLLLFLPVAYVDGIPDPPALESGTVADTVILVGLGCLGQSGKVWKARSYHVDTHATDDGRKRYSGRASHHLTVFKGKD